MKLLSKIGQVFFLLSISALLFTACEDFKLGPNQEGESEQSGSFFEIQQSIEDHLSGDGDSTDIDSIDCFEFVYPIDVILPNNGGTQTATNEDELDSILTAWESQNGNNDTDFPTLSFPIQITLEDGTTKTVSSDDELAELFWECYEEYEEWCEGEEFEEDCGELVFPVTVAFPDGSTQSAADEDELEQLFDTWYTQNPNDSINDPTFVYPIQVEIKDTVITVNNDDELEALYEDCFEDYYDICFEINFPITIALPDGTQQTAQDEDDLDTIIDAWYMANPDSHQEPDVVYPFDVTKEDGTIVSIQSEDELDDLLDECWEDEMDLDGGKIMLDSPGLLAIKAVKIGSKTN
ncbi:MAG: hypothetical protein AAF587_14000 [Bacteroidota bacterium]